MMNKVILVGNVVKKAELQTTKNDSYVTTLIVATNETIKRGEQYEEKPTFHECVLWKGLAKYSSEKLDKGDLVSIEGKINKREYVDKNQIKRYVTEIVVEKIKLISRKKKRDEE